MNIKSVLISATSVVLAGGMPLAAQAGSGTYLEFGGGAVELMDSDISGSGIDTEAEFDTGYALRAAVGHAYDNGWRAEVEIGYRANEIEDIGSVNGSGDAKALSGMINGYKDFDLGNGWEPYLGLGVGAVRVEADGYSPVSTSSIDDRDTAFGYQGIAGIAWSVSDNVALTADYRYLATDDLSLRTAGGSSVDAEYRSHTVMLGLRFSFGGGASDASAMAIDEPATAMEISDGQGSGDGAMEAKDEASAEAQTTEQAASEAADAVFSKETESETEMAADTPLARAYQVLFALDSAALSDSAQNALQEITDHVLSGDVVRIEATGHADASGFRDYNMALSQKRAEAVRDSLIGMGVDAEVIAIYWKGEEELLIATEDGVPEPRNRRVEIVIPE